MDKTFQALLDTIRQLLTAGSTDAAIQALEAAIAATRTDVRRAGAIKAEGPPLDDACVVALTRQAVLHHVLLQARHVHRAKQATIQFDGKQIVASRRISPEAARADMSHREISEAITNALIAEAGGYYYWPIDVYDDHVVYEQTERTVDFSGETRLYRRDYAIGTDEEITFGEKIEVQREVIYVDAEDVDEYEVVLGEGGTVTMKKKKKMMPEGDEEMMKKMPKRKDMPMDQMPSGMK